MWRRGEPLVGRKLKWKRYIQRTGERETLSFGSGSNKEGLPAKNEENDRFVWWLLVSELLWEPKASEGFVNFHAFPAAP